MKDIDPEKIERLREEPSFFVESVLDVVPHPYQKEIMDNPNDRKCIAGGRQIGKTTMMSWMAIHEMTMYPNRRILIVAPTQRQALNFMRKLKKEISDWIENEDEYGLSYVSKSKIEAENGSWIEALPALEETIRGYTIDTAFADEAAFIDRQIFTSVISPMLATTNGQFVLGSTAWGKQGYFYNKFEEDEYWDSYRISSIENPDIPSRQVDEWRRDMTQMEFEREVLAQFSDKKNAFFKNRDINAGLEWTKDVEEGQNVVYPDQSTRTAFLGVDPAATGDDEAVLTSIDSEGNIFDINVIEECEIPELEREIRGTLNRNDRNYIQALIEENGLGEGTVHRFEDEFVEVEGFRTTIRSKESIYNQAKNKLQSGELNIPDREDLKSQLRTIEYEQTNRGNMKIYAPGDDHDDMCLSEDTEILTKQGWVSNEEISYSHKIAAYSEGNIQYEEPLDIIRKPFEGDMINFIGDDADILVTPNHKMVFERNTKVGGEAVHVYDECQAGELTDLSEKTIYSNRRFFAAGNQTTSGVGFSEEQIKLFGYLISEGWVQDEEYCRRYAFGQSENSVEFDKMRQIAEFFDAHEYRRDDGVVYWQFHSDVNDMIDRVFDGELKKIPREILSNADHEQLELLYQSLMEGDGNLKKNTYHTSDETLAKEFQELCHKIGMKAAITSREETNKLPQGGTFSSEKFVVYVHADSKYNDRFRISSYEYVPYDGEVWCVNVPSGKIITRRNGHINVVGNCDSLCLAVAAMTGKTHVERQTKIFSSRDSVPSNSRYEGQIGSYTTEN